MIRTNKLVLLWLLSLVLFFRCSYFLPTCVWLLCLTCRYCTITFSLKYMVFIIFKSSWVQFFVTSHMYVLHFENFKLSWLSLSRLNSEWVFIYLYFLLLLSADPGRQQRGARQGTRVVPFQPQTLEIPESVQKGTNLILAQAATCGHLLWRPLLAASGCKWLPMKRECGRPLAATRVAASGCRWKTKCWWPLADTCGHSIGAGGHWRPLAATRLAASGCKWLPMRRKCWWPLAATHWPQGGASGCRWEENDGGHWRPLATTRVAASGCKWLPGVGETICFTIHPLLGGEYWEFWEFSVSCALKIYNILRGRSLGNVKYCTVLLSMLREFLWSEARPIWNVLGHVASRRCVSSNMERR